MHPRKVGINDNSTNIVVFRIEEKDIMVDRKSYYEQRMEEQGRIREAIRQQIERQNNPEPVVELQPTVSIPDTSWKKAAIQTWLDENDVEWNSAMSKKQLLELIDEEE